MSTASFLLLRLPYVALREVLCNAGPREIFILSTCSRRSLCIVKSIKRSSPKCKIFFSWYSIGIEIEIDGGERDDLFEVRVLNTTDAPKALETINIGSCSILLGAMEGTSLYTYWDDETTGMKEMANYFTEIFHRPIDQLCIKDDPKWRVDWINSRQKSVKKLYYYPIELNVEDVSYIFSNLKVDNLMQALLMLPDNLTRPEIKIAPFSLNSLEIGDASWMTLEHILAFDCEDSCFKCTNLTSQNLNALLKHWINGAFSRLEVMTVSTNEVFNYDIVLEGMEFEEISLDVVRKYPVYQGVRQTRGGFDVTRELDGSTVTLLKDDNRSFTLVLTSRMQSIKRPSPKWDIFFDWDGTIIEIDKDDDGDYDFLLEVRVLNSKDAPKALEIISTGSYKVLLEFKDNDELATYWDDEITGMKEMTNYFTEIFHRPIAKLFFMDVAKWRVDWLNTRQKSVKGLCYEIHEPNVEDISYVLSNLKVDNWLCVVFWFPDKLTRPEIKIPPFSLSFLYIGQASWVTLEHILAFDCEYSDFWRTNSSSQDLNALLKHWINGGFSRLGELTVSTIEVFNYDIVLEGVGFEDISLDVVRQYPVHRGVRQTRGGFDVTRELDGSTVSLLKNDNRSFTLVLTSRMQVL